MAALVALAVVLTGWLGGLRGPTTLARPGMTTRAEPLLGTLPVAFAPNLGQWEHPACYVARFGAMTLFLEERGWTFTVTEPVAETGRGNAVLRGVAVRMTFTSAGKATLVPEIRLPGCHNYFLGNNPATWRGCVPIFASVRYRDLQPGLDVRAREHDGHFEYDLLLQSGAELAGVELGVEGADGLRVDPDGALVLETRLGPVRMPSPVSWEEGPSGEVLAINCRYVLRGADRFGFEAPGRRPGWALVVDPGLVWSTFLGSTGSDEAQALTVDARGATTVAGRTSSASFPTTPGAFDTSYNINDAFVTRLATTGATLVYSTFFGGTSEDQAHALALDALGGATIAGFTQSSDLPTTAGVFDPSLNGNRDVFVARLSPSGSSLTYSTYLGGASDEEPRAIAVDALGAATVTGWTASTNFPATTGAFDANLTGPSDAFVTRISPSGASLVFSTFLGGTGEEVANAAAIDAQGATTVGGQTGSANFPTTPGALDTTANGSFDAFVTRVSPSGSTLLFSTFLGGTGHDLVRGLAVDGQGATTVVGSTASTDFVTTPGVWDRTYNGGGFDVFAARLSTTGSSLVYSTFLGGTDIDFGHAIALDTSGAATITGQTLSADFPTTAGAYDTTRNGNTADVVVARLSPAGSSLIYSTYLGGANGGESLWGVALDAQGTATVAGTTTSSDFPTTAGAFSTIHGGGTDAFVTRLDMLPTGVVAFGRSSPGCAGALAISVTSMPQVGNAAFSLSCTNAPPSASGLLALTGSRLATPVLVLGIEIWIDPILVFIQLPATSNGVGASETQLGIPNGPWLRGTRLAAQFVWAGPTSPPPCPPQGLSASHALEITIQP